MNRRTFPLLRLPLVACSNVVRNMQILQILQISLCSKATKELAKSIKLQADDTRLTFGGYRHELIILFKQYKLSLKFHTTTLLEPLRVDYIKVDQSEDYRIYHWKNPKFTFPDWFHHILSVSHYPKFDLLTFSMYRFRAASLKNAFKGLKFACIQNQVTQCSRDILRQFSNVSNYYVYCNDFETTTETHGFLIQNLVNLRLSERFPMSFDDLLVTNSTHISEYCSVWTDKNFNRFLKLWRLGSNPNLKFLSMIILLNNQREFKMDIALKGLNAQVIPQCTIRIFDRQTYDDKKVYKEEVRGGFDIRRRDGTCATITAYFPFYNIGDIRFFVWP